MTGLTKEQVLERTQQGLINFDESPNTRTYRQILRDNTLTFFNFMNVVLMAMVLLVGSPKNALFMGTVIFNTAIGIIQEFRAKRMIDKLSILTQAQAVVLRDNGHWEIPTDELVIDDVILLKAGDQIPADAVVLSGALEVNESLLTGESDTLQKQVQDELFSGSFVTAGQAYCRVVHVGKDNYASRITREAKEFRKHESDLRNSLNAILKTTSIIIVPMGILLFYKSHILSGYSIRSSVISMVAALIGMIPEGLILLTSVTLSVGIVVLARKKTLVQELYCMETLARVDTLCLDKTGTITTGKMTVQSYIPFVPAENDFKDEGERAESAVTVFAIKGVSDQETLLYPANIDGLALARQAKTADQAFSWLDRANRTRLLLSGEGCEKAEILYREIPDEIPERGAWVIQDLVKQSQEIGEAGKSLFPELVFVTEEALKEGKPSGNTPEENVRQKNIQEENSRQEGYPDRGVPQADFRQESMRSRADDLPAPRQPEYSEYIYSENWDHVKPYEKESRSVSELALLPAFTAKSQQAKGRLDRAVSKEDYPWVFPDTMIKPSLDKNDLLRIMGNLVHAVNDINPTALALKAYFPACHDMTVLNVVPFSSERKYSGACFAEEGTYLIGASQFLFPSLFPSLQEECIRYTAEGIRVLVLAHSARLMPEHDLPPDLLPVGLVLLSDEIRPEAARTMAFFREQGVDLKVISGDDPVTVAAIAGKAGLTTAQDYCDASTLQTKEELVYAVQEYSVFGRVTPYQKKEMVKALKEQKRTVAMTGDGVNDVLALKAADCSIAMATGSDAAKNISNIVLLDSDFSSIPQVVNQGRRVINNIRTAASMFLIKTIFSVLLSLATIFWGKAYPFEPVQMSLISACAVGVPTFLLSQEFNYEKTDNGFLRYVFLNAFPAAVTITGCILVVQLAGERFYPSGEMLGTACFLVTGWNYMAALRTVYSPLNLYRTIIIYGMELVFFLAAVLFQNILTLRPLEFGMLILVFVLMTFSPLVIKVITDWLHRGYRRSLDEKPKSFLYRMVVFLKSRHIGKQE